MQKHKMQKILFNLLFHHSPGWKKMYVVQAGKKNAALVVCFWTKNGKKEWVDEEHLGIFTIHAFF